MPVNSGAGGKDGAAEQESSDKEAPAASDPPEVMLTKKELVERIVETTGIKRRDVKPVAEAVLQELGSALARGELLNLQPFGKVMVKSSKSLDNADVYQLRLRRSKRSGASE